MKKKLAFLALAVLMVAFISCKEKRCACTTLRGAYISHSLEPLGSHSSCSELDTSWTSVIDSMTVLSKTCVPEGE